MPYLSRIWLNPLRTGAQRMLRNPQITHAAVLGGLSRQPVDERVLWRLDATKTHRAQLLVLTDSTPSWEHVIEQGGWSSADEPQVLVRNYEPVLAITQQGREFAFRLRANTVRSVRTPSADDATPADRKHEAAEGTSLSRGMRVAHTTVAHQMGWLLERADSWGFEIPSGSSGAPDVALVARETVRFKRGRDSAQRVTLATATFEGRVRVVDADAARRSLLAGVGPARAYGCGLITLAPLGQSAGG